MINASGCGDTKPDGLAEVLHRAELGDPAAQIEIGFKYEQGLGVMQDHVEAVKWYRMAAEQGHSFAQYRIGSSYYRGDGVPQDYAEAAAWYQKAAAQGNVRAQFSLGSMELS